ncbi:anaerobic ribonucleoside-triphosphate reductase [Halanaerobiaceae bacterium ANBcell28]
MPRQKCEIYSRVVGFLTPVSQWNRGKKEEFKDRKTYDQVLKTEKVQDKALIG